MDEKKERFSIRKLTVGAASVLIGLTFIGVSGQTVHADTVPAAQNEEVAPKATTTDDTIKTADDSAVKITTETPVSSTKETDAQTQSTTKTSDQTVSTDVKNAASETEVKTETETAKKVEKDLTKTAPDEETEKTVAEDVASKTTDAKDTTTLKTDQKAALAKDLAAQKTAAPVQKNYNTTDWDGNLDNTTHEYTLTGYHGEDKENIYIPNTDDFIKAGTISDTDKVYITKDLIQTITRAGAESITIDDQGSDDKNKVYAKGDWSKAFNSSTLKKADLKHLDTSGVTNLSMAFANMPNIKSIDLSGVDLSHATNIDNMFYNNPNLESVNLSGVKFGNVTKAGAVFYGDAKLTDVDMSGVDLSHVNGANAWFMGDSNLTTVDFSNVTFPDKFTNTFAHADGKLKNVNLTGAKNVPASILKVYVRALGNSGATSIDLRGINFDRVTDLSGWFANMPNIKSIDLSGVDLSHATNIDNMFYNNPNLESVNLSGVKFGNVTKAGAVFYGDAKLTDVDMSGVDLSHVNGANAWFMGDSNLTTVDFSNVTFPDKFTNTFAHADGKLKNVNLTRAKNVPADFLRAYVKSEANSGATSIDVSDFDLNKNDLSDLSGLFTNMPNLKEVNVTGLVTDKVENVSRMFYNDSALTTIVGLDTWDTSNVTDMSYIFASFTNPTTDNHKPQGLEHTGSLKALDLSGWKTSNVTNMACMFTGQNHLETLKGLSNWNTSKVTNMAQMFHGLSKLQDGSLGDLSKWDTSNVTDMTYMFAVMSLQTDLSFVNGWKTGMVTDMSYMFAKDEKLQKLDLSNWDVSSVGLKETEQNYSFGAMFSGDTALTSVGDISHWRTDNVHDTRQMFYGTTSLKNIDLSGWNTGKLQIAEGMFWNSGAQYINLDHWDFSNIKRLDDYGFVKAQGELSGVENMFADLTNNAVIKMDGIVLPDANTVFVVTDFRGYHPIAVIANGKNGESLADLVKLNKQTWTDKNNQTVLGRQNTNKLVFFDADDLTKKVGIEGLNFIFDSEKDLADQFNTAIGEDAVKKAIGSLASKWDVQRDTENGKLKPALRLNNITPAAFVALLAVNGDPTEKVPEEVPRDIAMVYAQYKLHFIKDSNPGSGTTSDEKPNPDNHPTDNNGKNDDHHDDNIAPHGEDKPQSGHKDKKNNKSNKKETIAPKAAKKAKNNRGGVKKLGAVKTSTKNNVVKAATTAKSEDTLPQTGEKQNNLALLGLCLLSLLDIGSLIDRKRRN